MAEHFSIGDILWLKLDGFSWWPAKVISEKDWPDLGAEKANNDTLARFYNERLDSAFFWLDSSRRTTSDYSVQLFKGKETLMDDEAKKDSKLRKAIEIAKREANGEHIMEIDDAKQKQEELERQEKKKRKKMEEDSKKKQTTSSLNEDEESSDEDARENKRKTPVKKVSSKTTPTTPSKTSSTASISKPKPVNSSKEEVPSSPVAKPKSVKPLKVSKSSENSKPVSPVPVVPSTEDLTSMKSKLEEAIGKTPQNTAKIQQMLSYLMDNCAINRTLLEAVPIAKVVTSLKKHTDIGIANVSKELIEKWKNVVKKEVAENDKLQPTPSNGTQKLELVDAVVEIKNESDQSTATIQEEKNNSTDSHPKALKKLQKVKPEEKSVPSSPSVVKENPPSNNSHSTSNSLSNDSEESSRKLDVSKLPNLKDPNREYLVKTISTALFEMTQLDKTDEFMTDCIDLSVKIEQALFQYCGNSQSQQYKEKCRTIAANIKAKNNPEFRFKIVSGVFSPDQVCKLTPQEIASKSMRAEIEKLKKQAFEEAKVQGPQKIQSEGLITCGRCKKKNVSYFEMQTRSADEPMTVFCECNNCGHKFKF